MASVLFKWLFGITLLAGEPSMETSSFHPFYVTVTEINHNAADNNLEISCKIFTDDFETTLSKAYGVKIDLFNPKDKALVEKQIAEYVKKHLQLKLDSKAAKLEFVGFERENEAVWSYFQVSNTNAPKRIDIVNNLLYESFDEQIHLIHITVGANRKSTKLKNPETNYSFEF